jgi:hypothetical protein
LFQLTLHAAQTQAIECAPSNPQLTLHGLWVRLTGHLTTNCGWSPADLSRGAMKFAETALRDDERRQRNPSYCIIDLHHERYYDSATGQFDSTVAVVIKKPAVPAALWAASTVHLLIDSRDVDCYDLDYARFERWLWVQPDFVDEPYLTTRLINAAITLAKANWDGWPASHVIFIPPGRFRVFMRALSATLGLDRNHVRHLGQGVIGIDTAEHATLISLMGHHPLAVTDIQQQLNGATGWLRAGCTLAR